MPWFVRAGHATRPTTRLLGNCGPIPKAQHQRWSYATSAPRSRPKVASPAPSRLAAQLRSNSPNEHLARGGNGTFKLSRDLELSCLCA